MQLRCVPISVSMTQWRNRGVPAALAAAVLFGLGTPLAKLLLGEVSPWLLAGLLDRIEGGRRRTGRHAGAPFRMDYAR